MDNPKHSILSYLRQVHARSGLPFETLRVIQNRFGEGTNKALNELYKEGWIRKRAGVNSPLVELIRFE